MAEHPEWETWLQNQERWNGDYAYRGIYAAFHAASGDPHAGEARLTSEEDGGLLLSTNGHREPLRLADVARAREFAQWLQRRCCGDRYPDMRAWEYQQHEWFVEDLNDRRSW